MRLLLASLLFAATMFGDLLVSESGTFGSTTPTSTFTAPNASFSFSFTVPVNPTVSNVANGFFFDVGFSNFTYTLNGVGQAVTPAEIRFFNSGNAGLFDVCFTTCNGPSNLLDIEGAQAYSGPESAPTILTGLYTPTLTAVFVGGIGFVDSGGPVSISAAAVPEPSSLLLLASVGLICHRIRKRRSARKQA